MMLRVVCPRLNSARPGRRPCPHPRPRPPAHENPQIQACKEIVVAVIVVEVRL